MFMDICKWDLLPLKLRLLLYFVFDVYLEHCVPLFRSVWLHFFVCVVSMEGDWWGGYVYVCLCLCVCVCVYVCECVCVTPQYDKCDND